MHTISKDFEFAAAHVLRGLPADHPCARVHGHNYVVRLSLSGPLDATGFVFDYRRLGAFKAWLDTTVDHRVLNDVMEGNPTAERLAEHFERVASELLDLPDGVLVRSVGVSETPKTWAVWVP